ncbi:MAG: DUF167 domain-containing protein [Candidatus Omnitrophica bacterium]|nr:DUF167 domain-containing protein [Candidatus Omnitrophota bacterium]
MFISIKVITNAASSQIKEISKGVFLIKVTATAERGKANKRVIEILADYFNVAKTEVLIVKGKYNSKKIINIKTK